MAETHWDEIKELEFQIENGNPEPLIAFIRVLAKHNLHTKYALTDLCQNRICGINDSWSLLHEFAGTYPSAIAENAALPYCHCSRCGRTGSAGVKGQKCMACGVCRGIFQ